MTKFFNLGKKYKEIILLLLQLCYVKCVKSYKKGKLFNTHDLNFIWYKMWFIILIKNLLSNILHNWTIIQYKFLIYKSVFPSSLKVSVW